jgi:hypothetical protein
MEKKSEMLKVRAIEFRLLRSVDGDEVMLTHVAPDGQRVSVRVPDTKVEAWAKRQIRELWFA